MKFHALTALAVVYLVSLWVYQLPKSRVEGALSAVLRPAQRLMFTDRMYRMYAPDPRSWKLIPFLELKTEREPVRFWKPKLRFLPGEKWNNFLDHLAKALRGERFFLSEREGAQVFRRLAERICREESRPGDPVLRVSLKSRSVSYGELHGDIVWDSPRVLESFSCQ